MSNSHLGIHVIALYKYDKTSPEDLQFERGERLTILQKLTDGNWALAKNKFGETGLIPLNFVENLNPPFWLHGEISREETENLLQNEPLGSFLIRNSGRFTGDYTLSVVAPDLYASESKITKNPIQHYHIYSVKGLDVVDSSRFFSLDNKEVFPSLRKLVEHYKIADRGLSHPLTEPVLNKEEICFQILRKSHWIPRKSLVFGQSIGHGEFGDVLNAKYNGLEVAVKRYKATAQRQLIYEACVMSQLKHKNLLALIGVTEDEKEAAVTSSSAGFNSTLASKLCLITEFSPLGSLLAFLRSRGPSVITHSALLSFAIDVARGLAYMESRSFLHCDVAARNVLLFNPQSSHSAHPVAKLGDFGLAFCLQPAATNDPRHNDYEAVAFDCHDSVSNGVDASIWSLAFCSSQRLVNNVTRIPIKWTSPESIKTRMTNQVLAHLEAGERMEAPHNCPHFIRSIMLETWSTEPSQRPSFEEILTKLQRPSNDEFVEDATTFRLAQSTIDTCGSNAYDSIFDSKIV